MLGEGLPEGLPEALYKSPAPTKYTELVNTSKIATHRMLLGSSAWY